MNPTKLFKLKSSWDNFTRNHPKFPLFIKAVAGGNVIQPDTIIEINITPAEGKNYTTNLKITPEDLNLINDLKDTLH